MQEMAKLYDGPHHVILNHNEKNLGIGGHFNRIMELCHGELIVPSAGDDISLPERTAEVLDAWESSKRKPLYLISNVTVIDEVGRQIGLLLPRGSHPDFSLRQLVEKRHNVWGCAQAWCRRSFSFFGPMLTPLIAEDMVIAFRSALIAPIAYIDKPLVLYRLHSRNVCDLTPLMADYTSFVSSLETLTRDLRSIYLNWLADLSRVLNCGLIDPEQAHHLRETVQKELSIADKEIQLFRSSYKRKIRLLATLLSKQGPRRRLIFWIMLFLLPHLFRFYVRLRPRLKKSRATGSFQL